MRNFILASWGMCLVGCGDDGAVAGADASEVTDTVAPAEETIAPSEDTSPPADTDASPEDTVAEDNPLIGRVYAQALGVGAASYHFDAADDVYINYEHAPGWRMDNGAPFPARKAFTDLIFDIPNRAFYGTIDWGTPEATTVNGGQRFWLYRMVFSSDYHAITSGQIETLDAQGHTLADLTFGRELVYREVSADDPFPFAILGACLSRPLDLTQVVFVTLTVDPSCESLGTIVAFPLGGSDRCCDYVNGAESWANFTCDAQSGTVTADYALGTCDSDAPRTTERASATCAQSAIEPSLYTQIVGGGCGP